ncbi:hypothetical protein QE109_12620 [Fusibacter bizertensis]|uniref:Uncharacterized protein n=1 Tax=Fusibacter bizertensis TaxID=1488331 RepID=A0ABT6NF04_9FIRM|nr:hypothetical protein [Fusibacter bizertensis]MDH8678996.1 hypothetical protein [Fusibacter bizertensis]
MLITNFDSFVENLLTCGFSMGGENDEGVFALSNYFDENIKWHSGVVAYDPWEWRIKVLEDRDDIAYAKLFFKKSGFISRDWYPYFLCARRKGKTFEEAFLDGYITAAEKRVYDVINAYDAIPFHEIKRLAGFSKENKSEFEKAITGLQMKMFITMCGRKRKTSQFGAEFGWSSTVFCTVERYFSAEVFEKADRISPVEAAEKIKAQILSLNPQANLKKVTKFING